uniref:Centrosomal protein 192 n=1 Tax=Scophthalmus maximus TaxID=52904 RepID=A0A8D3C5R1_SCOMX
MADSFYKLEDEVLPSFLCESGVDSFSGGRATLGNVTLGSGPGLPVAASTVARVRPRADNRWEIADMLSHFYNVSFSDDDDDDLNNLPDDELELYFNKLVPPAMQRGRVEGQEIPSTGDFRMPDVRLAATGMDSCPASDEDTEDELESARRNNSATRTRLLPSTSRQLVGESNRPSFRPGLEGGSSDDESFSGRSGPSVTGIEHRRSAEGQVINPPVTGVFFFFCFTINNLFVIIQMGDRVGPVGTGESSSSLGPSQRLSPVDWSMVLDRQGALVSTDTTTNGVVYQNEEGQWVTDLAYYSSFAKEVDGKTSEDTSQFQTESFVNASDAMEKIVKDQEEFEKEHQFIQVLIYCADSSWKAPTNSHVLMRTSQVCSDFKQGDQSYLRLSFGEFFGQRSEALGCLGNMSDVDGVKRPSFGYIITSPEKREPFPLIHPTEFSATVTSAHSDTMELSDADKTLSPGDHTVCAAPPHPNDDSGSESSLCNQSGVPHDNSSSPLMLSISTIASAIADASISTDPSQLAAMIMELSKRSKARKHPTCAGAVGPAPGSTEEPHSSEHTTSSSSRYLCFSELPEGFPESCVEQTQCNFRPSTSPLTHSSPSQTSIPSTNGMVSPPSSGDKRASLDLSPQSTCSSPSFSRLTYISMNDGTVIPTPERKKQNNCTMALSTTIIRFSPTPPVGPDEPSVLDNPRPPKSLDQVPPQHSKSLDPLPAPQCKSPQASRCGSALSSGCRTHKHLCESNMRQLTKVDSGYCSNLNIQQTRSMGAPQSSQQWGAVSSDPSPVYAGGIGLPPSYSSSEGFHYVPIPSFKAQCAGLIDLPHQGDVQSLLTGRSLYNSQLAQQYLGSDAPLHPSSLHFIIVTCTKYINNISVCMKEQQQQQQPPHKSIILTLLSSSGQVVVPVELRFPHACCVGIASQTSLSLFNPSERWQQVSITVTGLAIDGEKVDSLSYQWLIIKNKTIIGPKSTEEQKVLFIPPQAGVYQCVLSVCSWPASAETEVAARASIFARRVVLVAIAENPAVEVEASKSGYLDFGDLPGGSAKSLPLKLLNKTHATVPVRLVISANATAWRCFNFSKHPGVMTSEAAQQAGHISPVSSPSVMNHVMHASYGENPESIMVWVHFKAPQKYTCSGELGPPDEYIARVDIELDSPGPSRVICSVPLSARSGTARVHAPKDLQVVKLPYGFFDDEGSFSVTPDELFLRVGEEQEVTVSFKAQASRKCRESLLTILVLPSGPQYEVTLTGAVAPEDSGKPAVPSAAVFGAGLTKDIPPILSNKQFIAWGGVTLGRAVQQKLVLRNNSTSATQQLRLLIRGQDQDCFQLQSMFSPEERLTRHGELSIRPREDVTVHLLFAPTRVASMLAKLEIKQSGVRPSQPGVKFTIPLSGYGGTSNIILEDQRKQADSYLAMLTDVAVGRVSKVCLCVRNTGSRAAFIKAMAFSDVQTRSVLKDNKDELNVKDGHVCTELTLSTQREQSLCQSANALLATICLFCGDEVSRQQYRRLLQSKPEAARKALSENSLLKNIDFNEKFLGEENVTETCDLPQRPNEAHIFYGNMSKVVVSLLGSTRSADCEEREHELLLPPSARRVSETDSQIQIRNNTSRELSFDLSWPAHCLTITPQHGVIDPQCHLQILISPNPSLATKPALLPWSGQVYVQCDGQQKFIKVQIRQDLALDVSAAPADRTLSALPALAATPVLPVARLPTGPSLALQTPQTPQAPPALVEISNKTIVFPITPSGETSEAQLEVQNGEVEVRWYLSSFAPPYVKGVDNTGDVYRATYTAFRCSRVSGTLGAHEKMQVPITFLPRDRGDYAQFWDLECHPVSEPQLKTRGRFQLCCGPVEGPQEGDHTLVKTEPTAKSRKRTDASEEAVWRGVYSPQDLYTFPATRAGESSTLKVSIRNNSSSTHELKFVNTKEPFHIKHSKYSLRSQHYLKLPVQFRPSTAGRHVGSLLVQSETSGSLVIQLIGEAAPQTHHAAPYTAPS